MSKVKQNIKLVTLLSHKLKFWVVATSLIDTQIPCDIVWFHFQLLDFRN